MLQIPPLDFRHPRPPHMDPNTQNLCTSMRRARNQGDAPWDRITLPDLCTDSPTDTLVHIKNHLTPTNNITKKTDPSMSMAGNGERLPITLRGRIVLGRPRSNPQAGTRTMPTELFPSLNNHHTTDNTTTLMESRPRNILMNSIMEITTRPIMDRSTTRSTGLRDPSVPPSSRASLSIPSTRQRPGNQSPRSRLASGIERLAWMRMCM